MKNLFGKAIPTTPTEILDNVPVKPCSEAAVLLAFSGGNDSRALAHVAKSYFADTPYRLELAAIDTELSKDGWHEAVKDFAQWVDLPVTFWKGEGFTYYKKFVEANGFPGNAMHSQIQNRLKGRAFRKMVRDRRCGTEKSMLNAGLGVWILSGIRKFESQKRRLLTSPYSWREGGQFINPLFYWQNHEVIDYMIDYDVPFAPIKQMDCGCGATVKDRNAEWNEIQRHCPKLHKKLTGIKNPTAWGWGEFDPALSTIINQVTGGQMWLDDGSIESYPVCIGCERDQAADEQAGMENW